MEGWPCQSASIRPQRSLRRDGAVIGSRDLERRSGGHGRLRSFPDARAQSVIEHAIVRSCWCIDLAKSTLIRKRKQKDGSKILVQVDASYANFNWLRHRQ